MTEITSKTQLLELLKLSNQQVIDWFTAIPADDFFTGQGEVWSASENVDHLSKAHKPIATALKLPRPALRAMFGKPDKSSMSYEELCQLYRDEIARGAQASGRYLPGKQNPHSNTEAKKEEFIDRFVKASSELVAIAEKWNDADLDNCLLPHPILGKLTVREILYFTIYHNLRHASQEGD